MKSILRELRRMAALLPAPDRRTLAIAALLALLTGGLNILALALLARLISVAQAHLGSCLALLALTVFAREACKLLGKFLVNRTGIRLGKELTMALADRLHHADLAALGAEPIGARVGRLTAGVEWFVQALRLTFLELLPNVFTLCFALAFALATQPWIGLVLLGVIPAVLWIEVRQMAAEKGKHAEILSCKDQLDGTLLEQLGGIEHIRAANTQGREIARVAGILTTWQRKQLRQYVRTVLFGSLRITSGWLFQFAIIGTAVALSGMGKMPIGDIMVYGNLFFSVYLPLWGIHLALSQAKENAARIDDLLNGLAEPQDASFSRGACSARSVNAEQAPRLNNEIVFETNDIVVEYPGGTRALDGLSLQIRAGEFVGIAGRSGSGKSTLAKLLLRLVHPTAGEATLAGMPLETISRETLSRLVGYVGQEPFLFAGTVADNVAYGCGNVTRADLRRAAELVGLHDEIMRLPGGYDAAVGERGRNLSGGQRQRLALARVLLKNPPILVLDEATSALDPANEQRVLRALRADRGTRTILLVAHRPAALEAADRVLVFAGGNLRENSPPAVTWPVEQALSL